jgi:hypothetical protein
VKFIRKNDKNISKFEAILNNVIRPTYLKLNKNIIGMVQLQKILKWELGFTNISKYDSSYDDMADFDIFRKYYSSQTLLKENLFQKI